MSPEFRKLFEGRKLMKIGTDIKLVQKEISAAKSDLKDAKESIERKNVIKSTFASTLCAINGINT